MPEPDTGNGPGLAPAEAFAALGNETRFDVLETLWSADEPLSYSDLKTRVGIDNSGQFNYHLDKLVGHFVERNDEGYQLHRVGEQVVRAVNAGIFKEDSSLWPDEVDFDLEDLDDATIWVPTRHDPTAHYRRATELVRAAEDVHFLTHVVVTPTMEALERRTIRGELTILGVITNGLFETVRGSPEAAERTRQMITSGHAEFYRYEGSLPHIALIDGRTGIINQTGDDGRVHGHVETTDRGVRSWIESTIEEYRRMSVPLTAEEFES